MKKFRIVAMCDPYNSFRHYRGQEVIKYSVATPITWVMEDNLTEDEALSTLRSYAYEHFDNDANSAYFDDNWIAELKEEMLDEGATVEEVEATFAWYKGAGFYTEHIPDWLEGETSYSYDVMDYRIEEVE